MSPSLSAFSLAGLAAVLLVTPFAAGTAPDTDGDGLADAADNCIEQPNPDQLDSNADGFGNACDPDLNDDGVTNIQDLGLFRTAFFSTPGAQNWLPAADFNGDNVINVIDLVTIRGRFLRPPGPAGIAFANPTGGSWHVAANWSPAVVPTDGHVAFVDLTDGAVVEHAGGQTELSGLRTTSALVLSGGRLSVLGHAQFNGSFSIDGGTSSDRVVFANAQVQASTTATPVVVENFSWVDLENVTFGADLRLQAITNIVSSGGLTLNNANILFEDEAISTSLAFSIQLRIGSTDSPVCALRGNGQLIFDRPPGVVFERSYVLPVCDADDSFTLEPGITLRTGTGGGVLGNSNAGEITLLGTLQAETPDRRLIVRADSLVVDRPLLFTDGGGVTFVFNNALTQPIQVADGTELRLLGAWHNASGNTIEASDGASLILSNSGSATGSVFNRTGATITATDSTVSLIRGVNAGTINLINSPTTLGEPDPPFDAWSNLVGTINAVDSTITLGGEYSRATLGQITTTGIVIVDGELQNSGDVLNVSADIPGTAVLHGVRLVGGTVVGPPFDIAGPHEPTFEDVILATDVTVQDGASLRLDNSFTLQNGSVRLASDGNLTRLDFTDSNGRLDGVGDVIFDGTTTSDTFNNVVWSNNARELTLGAGITVRTGTAGGRVGIGLGPVVIDGAVISSLPGRRIEVRATALALNGGAQLGAGALIRLSGDLVLGSKSVVNIELGGTSADTYGLIDVSASSATLMGTLYVAFANGFAPAPGNRFDVIRWGSRAGVFDTIHVPASGLPLVPSYAPGALSLTQPQCAPMAAAC